MDLEKMTPSQVNELVGDIIGAPRLTRWDLYVGPHYVCGLTFHRPEDKADAEAFAKYCNTKKGWLALAVKRNFGDRPKGMRCTARMVQWHIRYSDTSGGGWDVVEWLSKKGSLTIHNLNTGGWTLSVSTSTYVRSAAAKTMAHAACLVAMEIAELERGAL